MTATLSDQLRKVAATLRKRAAFQTTPKPIGNPVASRATGDLGSIGEGAIEKMQQAPQPLSLRGNVELGGVGPSSKPGAGGGALGPSKMP